MRKQCRRKQRQPSYTAIKMAIGLGVQSETHDLDILDKPLEAMDKLRHGQLDTDGFFLLNEMNTALFFAGELLVKRGVGTTGLIGWQYKKESEAAADALADIANRYTKLGKLGATGDDIQALEAMFSALRQIIPAMTRGELLMVLKSAADLIESTLRKKAA